MISLVFADIYILKQCSTASRLPTSLFFPVCSMLDEGLRGSAPGRNHGRPAGAAEFYVWVLREESNLPPTSSFPPPPKSDPPAKLCLHAALRSSTVVFSDSAGVLNLDEYACPWHLFPAPIEHSLDASPHRACPAVLLRHPAHLIWHVLRPLLLRPSPMELRSMAYRACAHGGLRA
jgi:hypothetical protein